MNKRTDPHVSPAAFDLQTARITRALNRGELTPDEADCAYAHRGHVGTICVAGEYLFVVVSGPGLWAPLMGTLRSMRSSAWVEAMRVDEVVRADVRAFVNGGGKLMHQVRGQHGLEPRP